MRRRAIRRLSLAIFVLPVSTIWAQSVPPEPATPTMPPVIVRPETESAPMEPTPTGEPAMGSGLPTGSAPAAPTSPPFNGAAASANLGNASAFPSLSEQAFGSSTLDPGGLNGLLRGETSLFDTPSAGTIVDRELINEKSAPDMFHALQNEVGVLMQQTARGQASPFIRGLTGEQVLVLIDGVRMNNAILRGGPNQYFNTVDPGQVERIEVIRGSQSVLWGSDAIGGAINIVTRGADPNRGDYTGGSFTQYFSSADSGSYSRANVEGWVQDQGIFAGGSYFNVRDLDRGGDFGRQPFTNYDQYAGDIKYNKALSENQLLTFAFSHFVQRDLPRSDRFSPFVLGPPANTPRPTYFDPQQRDLAYVRLQGLSDTCPLFDAYTFTASYSLTREGLVELRSPTQEEQGKFRDDNTGFQLTLARDAGDFGRVSYGADYYYDDLDSSKFRVNPQTPAQAPSSRVPQFPDDAISDRLGTFAYWDVDLTDRLAANAGVRYENANMSATPQFTINNVNQDIFFQRTYQDWISSIGLVYKVNDELNLVGGVYEGYRAPTLDDLTANKTFLQNAQSSPNLGSLNVQPEHSWTYEIGFKRNGDRLRYQVMQWWMQLDNYIARSVDNAGNVFLDNHDAYLYGTEADAEYLLDHGWAAYGNAWYTFGRDDTLNEPFSRIPPLQGTLGLRWRDASRRNYFDIYTWLVDRQDRYASVNLTDSRFPQGGNPGYATLNLRAGHAFGDDLRHRVSVVLENITDKYFRVLGSGVDGAGFNAILGYQTEW